MIVNHVNPAWLDVDDYVRFLNRGFSGQWDRASFEWYLRRLFNGRPADIVARTDGERILAGVTCCYRQVRLDSQAPMDVCVLSAGTTLPSERGHGHYRSLLDASIDVCRRHSCSAVLGFVTRENASGRGLLRLGARQIPSYYIVSDRSAPPRRKRGKRPVAIDSSRLDDLPVVADCGARVQFHYAQRRDWDAQFLLRPKPVNALRISYDSVALIEKVGLTDRLQWLGGPAAKTVGNIATLASASAQAGRHFFMYTLDPLVAGAASRLGLRIHPGFLMMLPLDRQGNSLLEVAGDAWQMQSGDRL